MSENTFLDSIKFHQYIQHLNEIKNVTVNDNLVIENKHLNRFDKTILNIESCKFNGYCILKGISNKRIHFKNCNFYGHNNVEITSFKIGANNNELYFTNCHFFRQFESVENNNTIITFRGCTFDDDLEINTRDKNSKVIIDQHIFESRKESEYEKVRPSKIHNFKYSPSMESCLLSNSKIENFNITHGKYNSLETKKLHIDNFIIGQNNGSSIALTFQKLVLSYHTVIDNLLIRNATFQELNLEGLYHKEGRVRFQNITIKEEINISNADLSRAVFNDVDLSNAKIFFQNTYLACFDPYKTIGITGYRVFLFETKKEALDYICSD